MADLKEEFARLCEIVATLHAPNGCPWDREQTIQSLAPKLIEESYEALHAVREKDDGNLREELGDVLLLVIMQAQIAAEEKRFTIADIAREVSEKLVRRHPHVFGEAKVRGSEAVVKQWEDIKQREKEHRAYLDGVAKALPALMRAEKIQKKAARVNFDWRELRDVIAKVEEELGEMKEAIASDKRERIADEIGDFLFAVVNLARKSGFEAEELLQAATDKFVSRFTEMEKRLQQRGAKLGEASLEQLDAIWEEIKRER